MLGPGGLTSEPRWVPRTESGVRRLAGTGVAITATDIRKSLDSRKALSRVLFRCCVGPPCKTSHIIPPFDHVQGRSPPRGENETVPGAPASGAVPP